MRKNKSLLSIVLILLAMSITACNNDNDNDTKTSITTELKENDKEKSNTYSSSAEVITEFWKAFEDVDREKIATCFPEVSLTYDTIVENNYNTAKKLSSYTEYHLDKTEITYVGEATEEAEKLNYDDYNYDTEKYTVNVYMTQTIENVKYDIIDKYTMCTVNIDDSWYIFDIADDGVEILNEESLNTTSEEIITTESNLPTTEDASTNIVTTEVNSTENNSTDLISGLSSTYADLNNRSFAIDGHIYTLGISTLQDMIDNGITFENQGEINGTISANYYSQGFKISLGEYNTLQVYVGNYTDTDQKMIDCPLCEVYFPVDIEADGTNRAQFSIPFNVTEDELKANSGEPTDFYEYISDDSDYTSREYEYKADSDKYIGQSGYTFEFVNGELSYITIDLK